MRLLFTEFLKDVVSRRSFLKKTAGMTAALLGSIFGFAKPAHGLRYVYCCTLCGNDCPSWSCTCWWVWGCCYSGRLFSCHECFPSGTPCNDTCNGVTCSRVLDEGVRCG